MFYGFLPDSGLCGVGIIQCFGFSSCLPVVWWCSWCFAGVLVDCVWVCDLWRCCGFCGFDLVWVVGVLWRFEFSAIWAVYLVVFALPLVGVAA